jgi:hypothetical protein
MSVCITKETPRVGVLKSCEHYSIKSGVGFFEYPLSRATYKIALSGSDDMVRIDELTDATNSLLREGDEVEVFLDAEADITVSPRIKWEQVPDFDVNTVHAAMIMRMAQFHERDGTLRQVCLVNLPGRSTAVVVAHPINRASTNARAAVRTILPPDVDGRTGVIIHQREHLHYLRCGIATPTIGEKIKASGSYIVRLDGNVLPKTIFVSQTFDAKSPLLGKGVQVTVRLAPKLGAEPTIELRNDWTTTLRAWAASTIRAITA